MAAKWQQTLTDLEQAIMDATRVPFTQRVMFDEQELLSWIARLKKDLPVELHQVDRMLQERDRLLEEARVEAEGIIREAKAQVARLVQDSLIVEEAKRQAAVLLQDAEKQCDELTSGAREYAEQTMATLETQLQRISETVRRGRTELRQSSAGRRHA